MDLALIAAVTGPARLNALKKDFNGITPIHATILVGDDPSSAAYVNKKGNACKRIGLEPLRVVLPQTTTTNELLHEIDKLNADRRVHGILLQHPVPPQIDERRCFDQIAIEEYVGRRDRCRCRCDIAHRPADCFSRWSRRAALGGALAQHAISQVPDRKIAARPIV